jgi:hypothetical protein
MERVIEEERISTADLANTPERPLPPVRSQQEENTGPLLPQNNVQDLQSEWDRIQTGFVDEPRTAVKQADELVARAMKSLAENFASSRNRLEEQWNRGDDVSTEDLRLSLKQYRTFFHRLLAI